METAGGLFFLSNHDDEASVTICDIDHNPAADTLQTFCLFIVYSRLVTHYHESSLARMLSSLQD